VAFVPRQQQLKQEEGQEGKKLHVMKLAQLSTLVISK
jgi:hypothetical protein